MNRRIGILLVNLGTPDSPAASDVRRYLGEFLSDPRVLDINPVARWILLHGIILRTRPKKSGAAYEKVWTEDGSPLLLHGISLTDAIRARFADEDHVEVELAMRYGNPSLRKGIASLVDRGCDRIVVLPLYPQYASSSTGSTVEAVYRIAAEQENTPFITVVPSFYDHPAFIEAFARVGRPVLEEKKPDHVLMSFHGLPERHMRKGDASGEHCLVKNGCCDAIGDVNRNCYRAQCVATARALADKLGIDESDYTVTFQSRLTKAWIRPFTDETIERLRDEGSIKKLAVFCPAFVADCLETLEEIGMGLKEDFEEAGDGRELTLVPSLNTETAWVDAVETLLRETIGQTRLPVAPPAAAVAIVQ
ncbi:MAG: ferrochelatase [Myxococcota bacterium]